MNFDFVNLSMIIANILFIIFVRNKRERLAAILFIVFYVALLIHLFFTGDIRFVIFGMVAFLEAIVFGMYKLKD